MKDINVNRLLTWAGIIAVLVFIGGLISGFYGYCIIVLACLDAVSSCSCDYDVALNYGLPVY